MGKIVLRLLYQRLPGIGSYYKCLFPSSSTILPIAYAMMESPMDMEAAHQAGRASGWTLSHAIALRGGSLDLRG